MRRVYFIKPIGMVGPIKIGCSKSPDGRRSSLETWSPFPLEIIAEVEGGFALERQFHVMFDDDGRGREWFNVTPELLAVIQQINEGTFDQSTLPVGGKCKNRKRRNVAYITPAFCYRSSVTHRIRHIPGAHYYDPRVNAILGAEPYKYVEAEAYLEHRDELEALIEDMRAHAVASKAAA